VGDLLQHSPLVLGKHDRPLHQITATCGGVRTGRFRCGARLRRSACMARVSTPQWRAGWRHTRDVARGSGVVDVRCVVCGACAVAFAKTRPVPGARSGAGRVWKVGGGLGSPARRGW